MPDLRSLLDPTVPVTPGGLVFRPSLRAAVGRVLSILSYAFVFLVPPLLTLGLAAWGQPVDRAAWLAGFAIVAGTLAGWLLPAAVGVVVAFAQVGFTRYIVDQDGIHVRTRILASQEQRVPWEKVTAVAHHRSVFDALLGVERLDIIAYGARGATLRLVGLRQAAPLRDLVASRMRQSASLESLLRRD